VSRRQFRDLAPPEEAHEVIEGLDLRPDPETVSLASARGRATAGRIDATLDVPGFDRSTMDGYAVQAEDTFGADEGDPAVLALVGSVHAGEEPEVTVDPGTAVEVSTGAVLPPGADAVVKVERTAERDGEVEVRTAVAPGDSVMVAGTDIAAGSRAFGPGTRITARDVGLLSALGITEVSVRGRPTVGIVSTGDELIQPGEDLDSDGGEIYDVNSHTLAAAVEEAGGEPVRYPHVGDDYDAMERILTEAAAECDLVLSSGSTSAGAVDVIYRIIERRGDLLLHGVAVKPGKPMLVGTLGGSERPEHERGGSSGDCAYVGLPGYPVSALTIFRTFVAPAIREAAGLPDPETGTATGRMAVREQYSEGRLRYMPVGLVEDGDGDLLVYPVDKGSGATTSLVEADGIVEMAPETEYVDEGERVSVRLFSPDVRPPGLLGVGEDDPGVSRLLDHLAAPRYLPVGSREGRRRMREGVPDAVVVAGPSDRTVDGELLGGWSREWGLIVPAGNPDGVGGLADLVDRDLRFVNRDRDSGLRASLDAAVERLAAERGVGRRDLTEAIGGFDLTTKAHESPGRRVAAGKADAGLGLCATASRLDLGFVALGDQRVDVYANPDRTGKASVRTLDALLADPADVLSGLDGFGAR